MNEFACILSIGTRCFTEIYLKQLNLKRFSSMFGSLAIKDLEHLMHLLNISSIADLELVYTKDCDSMQLLNNKFGFRTIMVQFDHNHDYYNCFHNCTFAHHDLSNHEHYNHFERCLKRQLYLKNNNIRTLFVLMCHENYGDVNTRNYVFTLDEAQTVKQFLISQFNCHLLCLRFRSINASMTHLVLLRDEHITFIDIYNNNIDIIQHLDILNHIFFNMLNVRPSLLLSYNDLL